MGFLFGDVCGKGAQAAAVTSLARYTMRTAAMLHEAPAAVLGDLNAALQLVVRADGSVETTPAHGTILGAVEHPAFGYAS